ncbi:hypothetical protein [Staphylococcus epidermidis]|uniref:hypothetical protein n=1 Tax=Staphylococcus epidermidis TaxID=1282 RepID=UPI001D0D5AD9|nr:hypothetical protein [Staphylococcus epidermidis]MCC2070767.1 hypothetical protein [Staphylococcus epidermidis]
MEYSKRTQNADCALAIISVLTMLYTIFCLTVESMDIKGIMRCFVLPIKILDDFAPLIVGTFFIGLYDVYVNWNSEGKIDERSQKVINAENTHQNLLKGSTLFISSIISLVIKLYKINSVLYICLLGLYFICSIILTFRKIVFIIHKAIKNWRVTIICLSITLIMYINIKINKIEELYIR